MIKPVVVFGQGVSLLVSPLAGLVLHDATRVFHAEPAASRIAPLLEPFLDPFVRSFLFGLEARAFDTAAAIVVWRAGAGALHAYRYTAELRRLDLLPSGPPLYLWNRAESRGPAAARFDAAERARLCVHKNTRQTLAKSARQTVLGVSLQCISQIVSKKGDLSVLRCICRLYWIQIWRSESASRVNLRFS